MTAAGSREPPDSDLEAAFTGEPALIPYVVAGDVGSADDAETSNADDETPDSDAETSDAESVADAAAAASATKEYVRALVRGGADVVELGLPFSEPIADGPTIQNGIERALSAGMTPDRYLDLVADLDVDVPVVCMTYYNLIYQYGNEEGVEPFVAAAADAGLSGLIVPDLPVEESGALRNACEERGLDLVFIVAPTTTDERLDRITGKASGFVYVQARLGTTGARADVSEATHESLARLAGAAVPKAVGFGVSESEHAEEIVAAGADGVVAGSVFVDVVASGEDVADRLEAKAAELKSGAREGRQEVPESEGT